MTKISIVTPTFNEEENIEKLCSEIRVEMKKVNINYEHIVIDNASTDKTTAILKSVSPKFRPSLKRPEKCTFAIEFWPKKLSEWTMRFQSTTDRHNWATIRYRQMTNLTARRVITR